MKDNESNTGEIVMYQPDETIRLEVRIEDETVWLTQQQMAELFLSTKQNVSLHINNIFREDELEEISVVKESLTTAKDGKKYKSLKDAGKKLFAYIKMQETSPQYLLNVIR